MDDRVQKSILKNILLTESISSALIPSVKKEECNEDDLVDDKVHVFETAIIIDNVELQEHTTRYRINKIKQDEVSTSLDNIKAELSSSNVQYNIINDSVKLEGISANDIKIEFYNGLLYCEHCQENYEGYCIECRMLVHILNRNALNNAENRARGELPNKILEIQYLFGQLGIFALRIIPEGVKFGPFTGLSRTECSWKIKGGKFVAKKKKSKYLNWMQYINPASNISKQNLHVFQYEDNLYYQSTRRIHEGEELLVYFGEEYVDRSNETVEVDFIPTLEHFVKDIFACTFCCLGFSSPMYLAKHKTICLENASEQFSIEELMQCPFCNIHLAQKEYYQQHMAYCCERNVRKCIPPTTPVNQAAEVTGCKTRPRPIIKCGQCKYRTKYKGDLKRHASQHYQVKTCKCGFCNRRFNTKESLMLHVENTHIYLGEREDREQFTSDYTDTPIKAAYSNSQVKVKKLKCSLCKFRTKYKLCLKRHVKTKHLKEFDYKCDRCDYQTNRKPELEIHVKTKHLNEFNYKCDVCDYQTNQKSDLEKHLNKFDYKCDTCDYQTNKKLYLKEHVKTKHLNEFDYKCDMCDYQTNQKSHLKDHSRTKHLNEFEYNCDMCDYQSNRKLELEKHVKTKHLNEFDYKCDKCDYQTNRKLDLERHVKIKHLNEFDYKCDMCDYLTNEKSYLEKHLKTKHLNEFDYNCYKCDYQTNHKPNLETHIKNKHLKEFNYKCDKCDYQTNQKLKLEGHKKTKHFNEFC